jgi:hypothetical protein
MTAILLAMIRLSLLPTRYAVGDVRDVSGYDVRLVPDDDRYVSSSEAYREWPRLMADG